MTAVDQKVVQMKFDNAEFQKNVADTLKSLDALNKGMKLEGATKGLHDLGAASKGVSLSHLEQGVQSIADRFKAMSVIATTALVTIAHQAVVSGQQLIKSLTVAPINQGLKEYELNLNSIQTILANTGLEGKVGLQKVSDALNTLNEYSDQTIYNFSQMAKNIGTFTAAGVKLDVATNAIKGIANLAAISGSSAEQASAAMYQLSQALAAGRLTLIDWNSVVNAGLGGKVLQDALIETARVHGVAIDQMIKDAGSFRNSLEKGWITSEILTETLSKFTGDLTREQLKTLGYNEQQIAGIIKMGKVAQEAATKVKTATQLINTLQESAVSGWAQTWQLVIGDFDEARELFTGINNVLGELIKGSADARNKVLRDWKELGGRTALIEAGANAFRALLFFIRPIRDAFQDIFPAVTGQRLYEITLAVRNFTQRIQISISTASDLKRTFAGVFAALDIGLTVIKEGIKLFLRLFGVASEGSGGILEFTANIGDFIVGLRNAIKEGKGIEKFFNGLGDALEGPIKLIKSIITFLGSLFDGFDGRAAAEAVSGFADELEPISNLGELIAKVWDKALSVLDKVFIAFHKVSGNISDFLSNLGVNISESLQGVNLAGILATLGTGAFAAFLLSLRGLVTNVSGIFDGITNSLGAMQNTLRAATLLQIALAVATLAVAVVALSKVDSAGLARSLTAITAMFIQLLGAMLIFEKLSGFTGFAKMPFVAASMILLGAAINILALAVRQLSDLNWDELARGLTGVTVLIAALIGAVRFMPPASGMISSSLGLVILAGAIKLLADSVKELSGLNWQELAKGLVGVGGLLTALTLFTRFAQANAAGVLSGAGIVLLAVGIKILASAVDDFIKFNWEEIGRGLAAMAGGLALIAGALYLIPPTAVLSAAGVLVVAASLQLIASAIKDMGQISWGEIGKGLTVMAGALTLIAAALILVPPTAPLTAAGILIMAAALVIIGKAIESMAQMSWEQVAKGLVALTGALLVISAAAIVMTGAAGGAAALLIVAGALAVLFPILMAFGNMSWEEMGKSLLMLAGVFVVLGLAGVALTALVPTLIGLGVAVTLLGVGVLAAGAGVLLFATALTALSIAGAAATVALVAMIGALAGLIPTVMTQLGLGLVAFANVIATAGPAFTLAMTAVLMAIINAIDTVGPKIIETLYKLLEKLLETMLKHAPKMTDMGVKLIIAVLNGVAKNADKVVDAATNVIVKFLEGLAKNQPRVIQAGVNLIISYVNGLADAIRNNNGRMTDAGFNLASAIIEGMARGLLSGAGRIASIARDVAKKALDAAKSFLGIKSPSKEFFKVGQQSDEGMALGLRKYAGLVENSAEGVAESALETLKKNLKDLSNLVSDNVDMVPVVRPVLDITDLKRDVNKVDSLFKASPLRTNVSFSGAVDASNGQKNNQFDPDDPSDPRTGMVTFNQYNTSPKALSTADIYRQTKNQLSQAKGALP